MAPTPETHQIFDQVHTDNATGVEPNSKNKYQMGDDEDSNEYHAIPGHFNNNSDPSGNYYVIPDPSKPSVKYTLVQKKKKTLYSSKECNIPVNPSNASSHSNEYELDCVENDYNKLYFPQQQNDATSSTYARLNHENNPPRNNNTNVYATTP